MVVAIIQMRMPTAMTSTMIMVLAAAPRAPISKPPRTAPATGRRPRAQPFLALPNLIQAQIVKPISASSKIFSPYK